MNALSNEKTVGKLNDLLKMLMETEQNYLECINQIFHRGVRGFFITQAQTKNMFVHQLALEIQNQGGEIYCFDPSVIAHFSFYENLMSLSFEKILDQCIEIEKNMISLYDDVLTNYELEETTEYLLKRQKAEMMELLSEQNIQIYRTHEKLVS